MLKTASKSIITGLPRLQTRTVNMAAMSAASQQSKKREGDISDSFTSLSGKAADPLPDRFRQLKLSLSAGHQDAVVASWARLLKTLKIENDIISRTGPAIIPEVRFSHLSEDLTSLKSEIRKRGAAVIRGVISEDEARAYKFEIEEYVRRNPQTRGFPAHNPQVIELYWSAPQLRARTHGNMLAAQTKLMTELWHVSDSRVPISLQLPLSYADRLRIRQPGDAHFALGPHQDGGSVERWEGEGYGAGSGVYNNVFRGDWEKYDPFDAAGRVGAVTNLYDGLGACSMFRMFQGWLAISTCGPEQGTLLVNPLLRESTSYALLRPFFRPVKKLEQLGGDKEAYLDERNWKFTSGDEMTSDLQGATPGHGQEFPEGMHPHLELEKTMVHIPDVRPGDFVVWHCDTIHAVDKKHNGTSDSSVLYIPVCPTTEESAKYVAQQRAAFLEGTPAPDFPGGIGESTHMGRPTEEYIRRCSTPIGLQSLGLDKLVAADGDTEGGLGAIRRANAVLGFDN
ncbi:hypothetical protein GE09DRAFT_1135749 [Coniochaeta sp. 2T2.1]|nr:hypothetical protein GE09DRAFT_1135749 [Coniochaeta sp. 2T2.1]